MLGVEFLRYVGDILSKNTPGERNNLGMPSWWTPRSGSFNLDYADCLHLFCPRGRKQTFRLELRL